MPAAGRLGDSSHVLADAHGCPGCPHPAIGPAVCGSPNVNVNFRPALRVGDKGIHAACCGPATWTARAGAPSVFINGRAAHRFGDIDFHCGGVGKMIEGSPNVFIGDWSGGGGRPGANVKVRDWIALSLINDLGEVLAGVNYEIKLPDGSTVEGRTDEQGVARHDDIDPGSCLVTWRRHRASRGR